MTRVLDLLVETYGKPEQIITDNGPEFAGNAMSEWTYKTGNKLRFIDPVKPIQNACIESF